MSISRKLLPLPLLAMVGANTATAPAIAASNLEQLRKEVVDILDASCARCHQVGKLEKIKEPSQNFGNVLDLEALVRDKKHVIAGNPDNSKLWKTMMDANMPYDVYNGDYEAHSPSAEDKQKVADWIIAEGNAGKELISSRTFVSDDDFLNAILDDLRTLPEHRISRTRYLTLANLYNGGASEEAMEVYRQGAVKLLNSLTYQPEPIMYEKLGPGDTILRVNLDDMGWDDDKWDLLQSNNPYLIQYDSPTARFVEKHTETKTPIIRADVFAFIAPRPKLYLKLLDLPDTFGELQKFLGIDINEEIENNRVARAGFQHSGVSQNNRMIERFSTKFGAFWNSYDFAGNKGNQSLLLHPMGPIGDNPFKHDGGEMFFTLPNGFQAYYLAASDGKMLISGPTEIVRDPRRRDLKVTNGISCISCHSQGIRDENQDEIRDYVLNSATFDSKMRKKIEAIHPPQEEMKKIMARDKKRFMDAMRSADLDPNLFLDGQVEMVSALSDQFERNLTLEMAAAEFGLSVDEFNKALPRAGKIGYDLSLRLKQDQVPRDQFIGQFAEILTNMTDHTLIAQSESEDTVKKVKKEREDRDTFDLTLFANKQEYDVDEKAVFTFKSDKTCFLTVVNVEGNGTSTVLLPNKFRKDPVKLKAGKDLEFPGKKDDFHFRLADAGKEKIIALCSTSHDYIPGIKYNFKTTTFAEQGSENKLNKSLEKAATEYTRAIRIEGKKAKKVALKKKTKKSDKLVAQARKAITIVVH
ncbi:MAG: DUF4384 domain-containing protein [Hyphomicrobiales bacterium]|nr:DUF4384 domain-containing protein [Hyphomicrobiales bacterium]